MKILKDIKSWEEMREYKITTNKHGNFFLNGIDITNKWHNFFSGLTMKQERDCVRLFIRRYAKKIIKR